MRAQSRPRSHQDAVEALETEREIQPLRKKMTEDAWVDDGGAFSTDTGAGVDSQVLSKAFSKLVKGTTLSDIDLHELRGIPSRPWQPSWEAGLKQCRGFWATPLFRSLSTHTSTYSEARRKVWLPTRES